MHFQAWEAALGDRPGRGGVSTKACGCLQAAADESRRLIGGLRPPALDELGIVEAIDSLVSDARAEVPTVRFEPSICRGRGCRRMLETTIFRIVQESLSNVRKHAAATARRGELSTRRRYRDCPGPRRRPGLRSRRRAGRPLRPRGHPATVAAVWAASRRSDSTPGAGTTIEVRLPVTAVAAGDHLAAG